MAFSASTVRVPISVSFAILALFSAAAAAAAGANATVFTNAISTLPAAAAATNGPSSHSQYTCYLCQKRNTRMIRRCPIATDSCHVSCLSLPNPPAVAARDDNDDCYVMKVYPDHSWVVVDVVSCRASAGCFLKCGYGKAPPAAEADADGTTPVAPRGATRFLPNAALPPFERCGDQMTAVPGV